MIPAWDSLPVLDSIANGVSDDFSLGLVAQLVSFADPHGNGDLIDAGEWDLISLVANVVILLEFLEALLDGALGVMEGGLHGRGLSNQPSGCTLAVHGHVRADRLQVLELVQATFMVNTQTFVPELTALPGLRVLMPVKPDARREGSKLEEAVSIEVLLVLGQTVEHLRRSLRIPQIQDLLHVGELLDL